MKRRTSRLLLAGILLLLLAAGIFILRVGRAFDGEVNAFPGGIAATMEAYLYSSGSPRELELDWGRSYGPLWPGHYRVTKWFSAEQPSGGHTDFLLAAEFTLG